MYGGNQGEGRVGGHCLCHGVNKETFKKIKVKQRLAQVWLKRWQASGEENHYVIRDQYLDPGLPHGYDPRSFRKHRAAFGYVCGRD